MVDLSKLTREQRETIADEIIAERKALYVKSFEIACPKCGTPARTACMNWGSAGGPSNHVERIQAVAGLQDVPDIPTKGGEVY